MVDLKLDPHRLFTIEGTELKKAFNQLAKMNHPDTAKSEDSHDGEEFIRIRLSYEKLRELTDLKKDLVNYLR